MKIIIFKSKQNSQWYFRIVASNGEPVAQSEGYTQKHNATRIVQNLINNLSNAEIIHED